MQHHLSVNLRLTLASALVFAAGAIQLKEASAQSTCVRAVNKIERGRVVTRLTTKTRDGACLRGEVAALTGPTGSTGATGATGADGQLRVYGDGSSGALTVSGSQTLFDASSMFTDVVVDSGATLTVPSGAVIRCTGTFTNNGTINVSSGALGGQNLGIDSTTIMPVHVRPHPGISARAAASGESGNTSALRTGGLGGSGLSAFQASLLRYPGPFAGGGGAGGFSAVGAQGGGSLVVLCSGTITNNGPINANGEDAAAGSGGGGGGVIILASKTSVTGSASSVISVVGGNGGTSTTATAPGGGGGGGIIHIISPSINLVSGSILVSGGAAGTVSANVSSDPRAGGPGGGGSGGFGGNGGAVTSGSITSAGAAGEIGRSISSNDDPTSLF